jgi:hypothetical protein
VSLGKVLLILKRTVPFHKEIIMAATEENEKGQRAIQEAGASLGPSSANVFEFLRKSSILNMDAPLRTLFEQLETLQLDPSTKWGVIGDSGHMAILWVGK